jgi:hypothetical protein
MLGPCVVFQKLSLYLQQTVNHPYRSYIKRLALLPAGSGDYKTSWTIRNGGWPRYISTNIAGMWRQVFKVKEVKGLEVGRVVVNQLIHVTTCYVSNRILVVLD